MVTGTVMSLGTQRTRDSMLTKQMMYDALMNLRRMDSCAVIQNS
jgi:hypothetical protein